MDSEDIHVAIENIVCSNIIIFLPILRLVIYQPSCNTYSASNVVVLQVLHLELQQTINILMP